MSTLSPRSNAIPTVSPALVLWRPRAAFSSLVVKPRALLLALLLLGTSVLPSIAFVSRADVAASMEKQMKRTGSWEKLPPENRGEVLQKIASAMTFLAPGGALLKRAFYLFGVALLAWFMLKATRPELRLSVVIAAVALGMVPVLFQDLLEMLIFLIRDPTTLNLDSPLRSHVGAFLPKDLNKKVLAFATGIDLFALWVAALVAYGLQVVSKSKSFIPYAITFGLHLVLVGASVAFAA